MSFVEDTKYCPKCDNRLPHSNFAKDKKRVDGLFPYCKVCFRKTRQKAGDTQTVRER